MEVKVPHLSCTRCMHSVEVNKKKCHPLSTVKLMQSNIYACGFHRQIKFIWALYEIRNGIIKINPPLKPQRSDNTTKKEDKEPNKILRCRLGTLKVLKIWGLTEHLYLDSFTLRISDPTEPKLKLVSGLLKCFVSHLQLFLRTPTIQKAWIWKMSDTGNHQ